MDILIIGGVAAGTKAAAKLKRLDRSAHITLLSRDKDISYAGCGLPYYCLLYTSIHRAFLASLHARLRSFARFRPGTNTRLIHFKSVPLLKSFGGYGISTVCASATPFGLTLAPG